VTRFPSLLAAFLLLCLCPAHAYDVLCRNGNTHFHAYFRTGVEVNVGPPTQEKLAAARVCRALLSWNDQDVVVAEGAAEVDVDLFGVDLGAGVPVVAFEVKNSTADCCMTYEIYSLEGPVRLVRRLHGGNYFSGRDSNLDGQIEIWTDDAAAIDGLEGLRASQIPFPPTCVLRFEGGKLLDVSSEFQPHFDETIAAIRSQMKPDELRQFKLGEGRLAAKNGQNLLPVRVQILELVWAYLYSNRERQAWQTLTEMWPAGDVQRIRAELTEARAHGMRAQVDGVSQALAPLEPELAKIYDATRKPAQPILVRYYPPADSHSLRGKLHVSLVVDCAGKVWSVKVSGKNKAAYDSLKRSTANWKFIPAFVDQKAVASRLKMTISLAQ
jgi:hypothetical protein